MRTLTTLLAATAATALTAAAPVFAQDTYVRIGGGYAWSSDGEANFVGTLDLDGNGPGEAIVGNAPETKLLVDGGFTGAVTAGRMFGQFGLEAEVRYDDLGIDGIGDQQTEDLDINDVTIPAEDFPTASLSEDDFSSVFVMANVVAELDEGSDDLTTYIAGGLGVGFHEVLGDDDTKLAYQFKAGVAKDFGGFEGGLEFAYLGGGEVSPDPEGLTQQSITTGTTVFTSDVIDFDIPIERATLRLFVGTRF